MHSIRSHLTDIFKFLDRNKQHNFFSLFLLSIALSIGLTDYLTGYEMSFSLFYLIPVCLSGWYKGRPTGRVMSFACSIIWFSADFAAGHELSHYLFFIWNTLVRLSFFLIVNYLLTSLHDTLEQAQHFSRIDGLTGIYNSRYFHILLDAEINRSRRYLNKFTIAYIDLDHFKWVNDTYGHSTGDHALRTAASYLKNALRNTDTLARLGGDEFCLLLPETDSAKAQVLFKKIHAGLLREMQNQNWPVTFSIGVIVFNKPPESTDSAIKQADGLMYQIKKENKNAFRILEYPCDIPVV